MKVLVDSLIASGLCNFLYIHISMGHTSDRTEHCNYHCLLLLGACVWSIACPQTCVHVGMEHVKYSFEGVVPWVSVT